MDRSTVISLVKLQAATDVYPTLSDTEVGTLVDQTARWSGSWAASTPYVYGDTIIPSIPNGHVYQCIQAGTSGADAPNFTLYSTTDARIGLTVPYWTSGAWGGWQSGLVGDGTVIWSEAGPAGEQYDVMAATRAAWLAKAARASADVDIAEDGGDSIKRNQVAATCERMAQKYVSLGIA